MLGRACSSRKIRMMAGTAKTAATIRPMINRTPIRQLLSDTPRRAVGRGATGEAFCGGGAGAVGRTGVARGAGSGLILGEGGCATKGGFLGDCFCCGGGVAADFTIGGVGAGGF